jgi:hypothetical protein
MNTDQDEPDGGLSEGVVPEPSSPTSSPTKRRVLWPARVGVGAAVSFAVLSILYGVNQSVMIVGLLVICTAGLGLIPIVFLSWVVGWIVIGAWEEIGSGRGPATVS